MYRNETNSSGGIQPPSRETPENRVKPGLSGRVRSFLGALKSRLRPRSSLKETVNEVIDDHIATSSADREEKRMLRNVLAFSELNVEDVMVPKVGIIHIRYNNTLDEIKKVFLESPHTRFPVCRGTLDDVAGFIHVKDLVSVLCDGKPFHMERMVRQILVAPPSMRTSALLLKMQVSRVHMALVVDEYGGTMGLVTLEDLVEEIVGEIEDEHDREDTSMIVKTGRQTFEINALAGVEMVEDAVGLKLRDEESQGEFDTLGGLIFFLLGRVPVKGEVAVYHREEWPERLEFEILDADPRRVKRVLVRKKPVGP